MVIYCIPKWVGATVNQYAEQQLPEGIHTESECN